MAMGLSSVYDKFDHYSSHHSSRSEWSEAAWRARCTNAATASSAVDDMSLRCFDCSDFNSQHSALTLFMLTAGWWRQVPQSKEEGLAMAELFDMLSWVVMSGVNVNIRWEKGANSVALSTLGSGIRWTT
eukprot:3557029-Amphidinium_carterae.1